MAGVIRTALARVLAPLLGAGGEGQPRPGPWYVHDPDGWLPNSVGQYLNYWQMGYDPQASGGSAIAQACINAYAQTMAMCPGDHWKLDDKGGRERVTNSGLSRILRRPNDYQSRSDFVLNLGRDLYGEGNTYALAIRNDRREVQALHPFDPKRSKPVIAEDGSIFYQLAGNNVVEHGMAADQPNWLSGSYGLLVPARDVLHIKLDSEPGQPLLGIPPSRHAENALTAQNMIGNQLLTFFSNQSRPSGILSSDVVLTKQQADLLRQAWNEQSKGLNAGGIPVLSGGLKWYPMTANNKDSDLANLLKLSAEEVFMVYGVPPAILGLTDKSSFASTEALMQFWLARGLGFAMNHVETAIDHFFGLKGWPHEYCEFDSQALLRVAYKDRIEALARGTISGIFSPDEARNSEDLPKTPYGSEPRVQQQVVPLSAWANPQTAPTPRPAPSPPAPGNENDPPGNENDPPEGDDDEAKAMSSAALKRHFDEMVEVHDDAAA